MFFQLSFWIIIAAGFAALQLFGDASVRTRAAILSLVGISGIVFVLNMPFAGAATLVVSVAAIFVGCRRLLASGPRDGLGLALLSISPLLIAWVLGKLGAALESPHLAAFVFVGMSYLLVKSWTLLKDIVDGKVRDIDPLMVAAYFLHLPTFIIGPMHYFSEFYVALRHPCALSGADLVEILFRFVLGLFKVTIVSSLLAPASLLGVQSLETISVLWLIKAAFIYSLVLYLDFSGYCDMAIATSRLLGVEVPENFNWPFLATSIRDFWRRWHITFSRALTAHIFVPLTRALQVRLPNAPGLIAAYAYFGTFLFCGYWHGATANFLVWGLWHAFGLIVQDAWTRVRRRAGIKPTIKKTWFMTARDTIMTFSFVSVGWIFFVLPISKLQHVKLW